MKVLKRFIAGGLLLMFWVIPNSALSSQSLGKNLRFLDTVEEIDWYLVDEKNIIIGWKGIPDNFYGWNHRAAIRASKVSLYEVNVWSVRHNRKGWRPGKGGQLCSITAKYGRLKKADCRK